MSTKLKQAMAHYQEYKSTFTHHGIEYDLNYFLLKAESLPVTEVAMDKLDWIIHSSQPEPERVAKADTAVPILVTVERGVYIPIDGTHRIYKAKEEQLKTLPAKLIPADWFRDPASKV